ncbi:unnamed protein product [Urochloa humidicola]
MSSPDIVRLSTLVVLYLQPLNGIFLPGHRVSLLYIHFSRTRRPLYSTSIPTNITRGPRSRFFLIPPTGSLLSLSLPLSLPPTASPSLRPHPLLLSGRRTAGAGARIKRGEVCSSAMAGVSTSERHASGWRGSARGSQAGGAPMRWRAEEVRRGGRRSLRRSGRTRSRATAGGAHDGHGGPRSSRATAGAHSSSPPSSLPSSPSPSPPGIGRRPPPRRRRGLATEGGGRGGPSDRRRPRARVRPRGSGRHLALATSSGHAALLPSSRIEVCRPNPAPPASKSNGPLLRLAGAAAAPEETEEAELVPATSARSRAAARRRRRGEE